MALKTLVIGLGIGLAAGLGTMAIAGGKAPSSAPAPSPAAERGPRIVEVAEAAAPAAVGELRFSGVVRAQRRADVAFTVPGRIGARPVDIGARVRKGQVVARLDAGQYRNGARRARASRESARARLDKARRDLSRVEALLAERAAGLEEVEAIRTQVEAAEASFAATEAQVAEAARQQTEAVLVAPFAGVVTRVLAEPGEYASPGRPVLSISATSSLEVEVDVPESLRPRVAKAGRVVVELPLLDRAGIEATVHSIGEAAGAGRLFPVVVSLPEGLDGISPGVTADVVIAGTRASAGVAVPLEALVNPTGGTSYVYKLSARRAERVDVSVVRLSGRLVAVEGALAPGDTVITRGQENLVDGEIVGVRR